MDRTPVESSNISSIGFDAGSGILEVEFRNGSIYDYIDVDQQTATDFMNASSHGSFLWHNIRGKYTYQKIA